MSITYCYRLNVYVPPKFLCWLPHPLHDVMVLGGGAVGNWSGHESGVLMS